MKDEAIHPSSLIPHPSSSSFPPSPTTSTFDTITPFGPGRLWRRLASTSHLEFSSCCNAESCLFAALAASLTILGSVTLALAGDDGFVSLFNGKDLTGWKWIVARQESGHAGKDTFTVKDGVIVVSGKPNGYFYTEKSYKNYILKFDWKYIKDGNSGLLVHITGDHKVWPKCVEVQGLQKDHGNIFAIGGAKGKFKKDAEAQKKAIKFGEWNTTEVLVKDGEITSKINGIHDCHRHLRSQGRALRPPVGRSRTALQEHQDQDPAVDSEADLVFPKLPVVFMLS